MHTNAKHVKISPKIVMARFVPVSAILSSRCVIEARWHKRHSWRASLQRTGEPGGKGFNHYKFLRPYTRLLSGGLFPGSSLFIFPHSSKSPQSGSTISRQSNQCVWISRDQMRSTNTYLLKVFPGINSQIIFKFLHSKLFVILLPGSFHCAFCITPHV